MSINNIEVLHREFESASDPNTAPVALVEESSNPIDFAQNNPVDASFMIFGAVAIGLVLRSIVVRPK